jgi:hypothetical protein
VRKDKTLVDLIRRIDDPTHFVGKGVEWDDFAMGKAFSSPYVIKSIRSRGVGIERESGVAIPSDLTPEGVYAFVSTD